MIALIATLDIDEDVSDYCKVLMRVEYDIKESIRRTNYNK